MSFHQDDQAKVARGAIITVLGGIAFAIYQGSDFLLNGFFGLEKFGLYAVAASLVEFCGHFILTGFLDAITYFAAKPMYGDGSEAERENQLYRTLATAIGIPLVCALLLAVALQLATPILYDWFWQEHDPLLIDLITAAAWSLPALVLVTLPTEALKAKLDVKWSIGISQVLLPYLTGAMAVVIHAFAHNGIMAMSYGLLVASYLCIIPAIYAYSRAFSVRKTLAALATGSIDRAVISFALPQSVNMALNLGMVRIDTLVLSGITDAATLGAYSLVARLTQQIRLAKMAFSGLFGPLVAKYHASNQPLGISQALTQFATFTGSIGIIALLLVMATYPDIVLLNSNIEWSYSYSFAWLLCVGPVMSCFFGFAGNLLLMTGHSRLLLINATVCASVNLILNLILAPSYGLFGAALGTAIASFLISSLQIIETAKLEGHRLPYRQHARTLLCALPSVIFIAALPHSSFPHWPIVGTLCTGWPHAWQGHLIAASLAIALYVLLQLLLPGVSGLRFRRNSEQ